MQFRRAVTATATAAAAAAVIFSLSLLLLPSATTAHNITDILTKHPEFSTFNRYLTEVKLAQEINHRQTITVCAVDNAGMTDLLSKNLTLGPMRNVLSLHVLLDYFDSKKLHQISDGTALAATAFQATGAAPGASGFVNITDLEGGKVGFAPKDNGGNVSSFFVKQILAIPYNISVIQISNSLQSVEAEAPAPEPAQVNLTDLMAAHGCKIFAETLSFNSPAQETFQNNVQSGITIFCPGDDVMKKFIPKFKNLTADGKQSLLEYHATPIYASIRDLRSGNGLTTTLATDGARKFSFTVQNDGNDVTIQTKLVTAKIVNTLVDKSPLAIHQLNKVLLPEELFKSSLPSAPSPAPADAPAADEESPPPAKKKPKSPPAPAEPADSPADAEAPDGDVADQTASGGVAARFGWGGIGAVVMGIWFGFLQL